MRRLASSSGRGRFATPLPQKEQVEVVRATGQDAL